MALELAANSGTRGGGAVVWLALHTAEGGYDSDPADVGIDAGSAASLLDFFRRSIGTDNPKSCHAIADDDELLDDLVDYSRKAFTLRNGNPKSDNLEQMGLAKWTRAQWLEHDGLLTNAARWVARRAKARGWPASDVRHLSVAEVRAGNVRGVIVHYDYTQATGDGTHWDCGPDYPIDVVIARAQDIIAGTTPTEEDWMAALTDAQQKDLYSDVQTLAKTVGGLDRRTNWMQAVMLEVAEKLGVSVPSYDMRTDSAYPNVDQGDTVTEEVVAALTPPKPEPGASP